MVFTFSSMSFSIFSRYVELFVFWAVLKAENKLRSIYGNVYRIRSIDCVSAVFIGKLAALLQS